MIRAINFDDFKKLQKLKTPGSFHIKKLGANSGWDFWYYCPCGCGQLGVLTVGLTKPTRLLCWEWNGSYSEPTLDPFVSHGDHWFGWLHNGYWNAV